MNDAGRIGFLIRGDYSAAETYDFLDVVYYEGSSYVAKKITIGNTPEEDNEYWHIFAKGSLSPVIGVKGESEATYRDGYVNLTAANVGAVPKKGDVAENTVSYTSSDNASPSGWLNFAIMQTGEKLKEFFNKVSIMASNVRYLYKMLGTTSISSIGGGTVTGAISQLNTDLGTKQATVTGAASSIASANLTANRALVSNASGKVAVSAVTATELGYLDGVTSNVQTQLNKLTSRIAYAYVTLSYETSSALRGNHYFSEGTVIAAVATPINISGTPVDDISGLGVGTGHGGAKNRVDIWAYGSGFLTGHVLSVFCMAYIQV